MSVAWGQVLAGAGVIIAAVLIPRQVLDYQSTGLPTYVGESGPGGTFNNAQQSHYIPGFGGGQGYPGIGGTPYG